MEQNQDHPYFASNRLTYIPQTSEGATAGLAVVMSQLARYLPAGLSRKAILQRRSDI